MKESCPTCKWIGSAFALLPFAWLVGLLGLVIRARLLLGEWPRPSRPDPKSLPFELHHLSLWFGLFLVVLALVMATLIYGANAAFLRRKLDLRPFVVFLVGATVIGAMIFGPHLDFNWVAWFLD